MSQEKLTEFLAKAQGDRGLMAEAKDALENSEGPDKFVALGKKNGYDFIEKEVLQLVSKPASELSESELDAVAGGVRAFASMKLSNPWVLGALIATAIAVPIAVSNNRQPGSA